MKRDKLTLDEIESRECIAQYTSCSGIRLSGVHGYVCEACLSYAISALETAEANLSKTPCGFCGSIEGSYGNGLTAHACKACCKRGLEIAGRTRQDYMAVTSLGKGGS